MLRSVLLMVPLLVLLAGCRPSTVRTHETCVKECIFCVQHATRHLSEAEDFESIGKLDEALRRACPNRD